MRRITVLAALAALLLVVGACGGGDSDDDAGGDDTGSETTAAPSGDGEDGDAEDGTTTAAPAESLVVPIAAPCSAIDKARVTGLLGGSIASQVEWKPGDSPFGGPEPSKNFGCLYRGEGLELGLSVLGNPLPGPLAEERFAAMNEGRTCSAVDAPEALVGDFVQVQTCTYDEGTTVDAGGVFGETGVTCGLATTDGATLTDEVTLEVIDLCTDTIVALAGG